MWKNRQSLFFEKFCTIKVRFAKIYLPLDRYDFLVYVNWSRNIDKCDIVKQLQDVLAKSDRAMAVVRDLFGDDPRKYKGLPNVTAAPHSADHSDLDRLVSRLQFKLSFLSFRNLRLWYRWSFVSAISCIPRKTLFKTFSSSSSRCEFYTL